MKRSFSITLAIVALLACTGQFLTRAAQASADEQRHAFTPDTIAWGPAPSFLAPGAQLAVLEGDPTSTTGDFTVRLKMPDGYRIAPHFHPFRENVTVLEGSFKVGMGDHFDTHKMSAFTTGSFAFLDPDMHHYAMACGQVIVQVHGKSPFQFNFINPEDDASQSK